MYALHSGLTVAIFNLLRKWHGILKWHWDAKLLVCHSRRSDTDVFPLIIASNVPLSQLLAGLCHFPASYYRHYTNYFSPELKPRTMNNSLTSSLFVLMQHVPSNLDLDACEPIHTSY